MKKKIIIITLITVISVIELLLIKPVIPPFFGMNLTWKILYSILMFGFPLLIIIPIALIVAPFAILFRRKRQFKLVWFRYMLNTFLSFGILILIINTIMVISKFGMGNDPFPLPKYDEIKGFDGNLTDLKVGEFEYQFGLIKRYPDKQIEIYTNGDSAVFTIEWISNNEYRLIQQGENLGMNDTLDVRITNNTPEYYECYIRYGEYADFQTMTKKYSDSYN